MGNGLEALSQHPQATEAAQEKVVPAVQYDPTFAKATVVERTLLAEGIICSLIKPKVMESKQVLNGPKYDHFFVPLTGGGINFHLFDKHKVVIHGKRMWVECKIWKKEMLDGKMHLYVDLHPTDKRLTHERKIWQNQNVAPKQHADDTLIFECLGQTKGVLGFVPANTKIRTD
ncbi:MAG: hypothetical protein ACI9SY_000461 [Candidatus Paceibacteria bacterium]|jgi:hypothetical protein